MLLFLGVLCLISETLACDWPSCQEQRRAWLKMTPAEQHKDYWEFFNAHTAKPSFSTPSKPPISNADLVKPTGTTPTSAFGRNPISRAQEAPACGKNACNPKAVVESSNPELPKRKPSLRRSKNPRPSGISHPPTQVSKGRFNHRTLILVDRAHILESSIKAINQARPQDLAKGVNIRFVGEKNLHARPNWYEVVAQQLSESNYLRTSGNLLNVLSSGFREDAYRFFGRLLALHYIANKKWTGTPIAMSLKNYILGLPVELKDVEYKEMHAFFTRILTDEKALTENGGSFFIWRDASNKTVDLVPGGSIIRVTWDNRKEYVSLAIKYNFHTRLEAGLKVVKEGFDSVINEWRQKE